MQFSILLIGGYSEGKTSLIKSLPFPSETKPHNRSLELGDSTILTVNTNVGEITLEVNSSNHFHHGFDAQIRMFSYADVESLDQIRDMVRSKVLRVIVGGKRDIMDPAFEQIDLGEIADQYPLFPVSINDPNYDPVEPFLYILKRLTGNEDLTIIH